MKSRTVKEGPWPKGEDLYHADTPSHAVYNGSKEEAPRLLKAVNVDIDDGGRPLLRSGTTNQLTITSGLNVFSAFDTLFVQDGGAIKKVDTDDFSLTNVVTGLSATDRIDTLEHAGTCWYTNGVTCGTINSSGTHSHWGMDVPPTPTLSTTSGDLPAGRYQVACTLLDSNGIESGASPVDVITLTDATKDITVDLSSTDSNAVYVNIYASAHDQPELLWQAKVAVGSLPYTLSDVRVSTRPLRHQYLREPIPGDGLFSYMGWILVYRDNALFRSSGLSHHVFKPKSHVRLFPDNIVGGGGTESGFWIATERGMWFVSGDNPANWREVKKDSDKYAKGQVVVDGNLIEELNINAKVVLFVGEQGLVAGLPGGNLVYLTQDRLPLDVSGKRASIVLHTQGNISRVLFSLN